MRRKPYTVEEVTHAAQNGYLRTVVDAVTRLHVGASDLAVVRLCASAARRHKLWKVRAARKVMYRFALSVHANNRTLYRAVVSGRLDSLDRLT